MLDTNKIELTKDLADTICCITTLGFIKDNINKTKFIYIPSGNSKDTILGQKLNKIFKTQILHEKEQDSVNKEPWVIVKNDYPSVTVPNSSTYVNLLTNRLKQATFYGAYIGAGFNVNTGQIKLVGSSNIYTYKVDTKEFLLADNFKEIEKSYENAKNTANQIKSFLPSILNASEVKKAGYCLDPNFESLNEVPEHKIQSNECYASVHGLVKAAIYFNNNKDFVPIEHALSKDTIKVASCIPCSIFASAINRPVNYTHLGRGDSWNFPLAQSSLFEKDVIDDKRKMFYKYVKSCFLKGLEFVPHLVKEKLDLVTLDNIKTKQEEVVGNIFLYSLTFEGSFTERMLKFLI